MWYEYTIPVDFELQKLIIRKLRKWIQDLEKDGFVKGFAFDHYVNDPDRGTAIYIRFDYPPNRETQDKVKKELVDEVRKVIHDYELKEAPWSSKTEGELEAYEFGSRCAFLFWDLVERGRLKEKYVSDFYPLSAETWTPFVFQWCFNHGVMNSLNIPKIPNEQIIHLKALMESTKTKNIKKLFQNIRASPKLSQLRND